MVDSGPRPDTSQPSPLRPITPPQSDYHVHLCHALAHYIAAEFPLQAASTVSSVAPGDEHRQLTFIVDADLFLAISRELRPYDPAKFKRRGR
jgi:hypothetical protein